jgi:acyl-CoA dehydrogenase
MSDTARMLDETAARLLERHAGDEAALLREAGEAGLFLALVGEADGGFGGGFVEASAIARQWGRYAAPLPIVEMLVGARLAALAGDAEAAGRATAALVVRNISAIAPTFEGAQKAYLLRPDARPVLVEAALGAAAPESLAHEPFASTLEARPVENVDEHALLAMQAGAALLQSAAMTGAMSRVLEIAAEYADARNQFGRPLAKFQAIQNMIAEAASELLIAEAATGAALAALDRGDISPIDWLSAKAQAGRAATVVAAHGHQVMGAIGFTDEHVLHRYTKRLWAWRDRWGRQSWCEAEIGRLACGAGGGSLWPLIADRAA